MKINKMNSYQWYLLFYTQRPITCCVVAGVSKISVSVFPGWFRITSMISFLVLSKQRKKRHSDSSPQVQKSASPRECTAHTEIKLWRSPFKQHSLAEIHHVCPKALGSLWASDNRSLGFLCLIEQDYIVSNMGASVLNNSLSKYFSFFLDWGYFFVEEEQVLLIWPATTVGAGMIPNIPLSWL